MISFPRDLPPPRTERWRLQGVAINGGTTVAGMAPVSRTDGGGLWVCEQSFLLSTSAQRKAARALIAQLDGGSRSIILPRHAEDGPGGEWDVDIAFATAAALRATSATVNVTVSLPLTGGEPFSVNHPGKGWRTYDIATAGELAAGQQAITFRPPLRQAATDEALEFQQPACVMRLANADECLGALDATKIVEFNPVWIESFDAA